MIGRLSDEISLALGDPEVAGLLRENGVELEPGTPQALADLIRSDGVKWRSIVKNTGIEGR